MIGSLLGMIGGAIGSGLGGAIGGGILSRVGRYLGSKGGKLLGNHFEQKWFHKKQVFQKFHNFHDSFHFTSAKYGSAIPLIFGKMRVEGKIIWINKVSQKQNLSTTHKYFKNSKQMRASTDHTEFQYYLSFAIAICEGEISSLGRIWHGDELIDIGAYKYRLYKGTEDQLPDTLINNLENGQAPAFRDLAYIVFEEIPLADFEHAIPNFSFEVTRKTRISHNLVVEDMVKSMVMIPGSGEYVYDTLARNKIILSNQGLPLEDIPINVHNSENIADAIYSLNQLQSVCSNIEWVAPVVCWFGNSTNAANCLIRPAVEFKDPQVKYEEEWVVGEFNRTNAVEISKSKFNTPNYGGSVNDASVIRYLQELKARKLKVMFYPMFFLDLEQKPWRGWLTGSPNDIRNFFTKKNGYNEFILHYAKLARSYADAFVIGSELVGLTKVKDSNNNFPAIEELVKLAAQVKQIVGANVLVTYAADWSEYHHTDGGWYNLDPLWSSANIDFIGIDAYFPITNTTSSNISDEELSKGFSSGEGYDYYVDRDNNNGQKPLTPEYAWKNVKYWWENKHKNPNGSYTDWVPKSKKIWFTEFGFPSIDKSPNQPNIFFDPNCINGGVPHYSNGETNFSIQRRAIRAFIEHWGKEECIEQMFLWTWDARPYPAWPHMKVWTDSFLWEKGHWVNNKFGSSSIAAIILELTYKCGININEVDVSSVDEAIEGFIVNTQQTCMDVINTLRTSHFFDINAFNGSKIEFIKRAKRTEIPVESGELIKQSANSFSQAQEISKSEVIGKINLHYINNLEEYGNYYCYINNERADSLITCDISLPLALSPQEAERIGDLIIQNAAAENKMAELILPIEYLDITPTTYINLSINRQEICLRVLAIELKGLQLRLSTIFDNINIYSQFSSRRSVENLDFIPIGQTKLTLVELPFYLPGETGHNLVAYLQNPSKAPLSAKISGALEDEWINIANLKTSNSIGKLVTINQKTELNFALLDKQSEIVLKNIDLGSIEQNNWHIAKLGDEFIRFSKIAKLENNLFKITELIRGEFGTESKAHTHQPGEEFIILTVGYNLIPISEEAFGQPIDFKALKCVSEKNVYKNQKNQLSQPYYKAQIINNETLEINIEPIVFEIDSWRSRMDLSKLKFSITLTIFDMEYQYETKDLKYSIDIRAQDLSGGYKLNIISISPL